MEPIKIKRELERFHLVLNNHRIQNYLEPIKEELDALRQAREYSKTCSLRETASWLHRKTGRYISHVGLKKRLARNSTTETEEDNSKESQEVNKQILARSRKKVAKAEQSLRSAKQSAENIKNKLLTIDKVFNRKRHTTTYGRSNRECS